MAVAVEHGHHQHRHAPAFDGQVRSHAQKARPPMPGITRSRRMSWGAARPAARSPLGAVRFRDLMPASRKALPASMRMIGSSPMTRMRAGFVTRGAPCRQGPRIAASAASKACTAVFDPGVERGRRARAQGVFDVVAVSGQASCAERGRCSTGACARRVSQSRWSPRCKASCRWASCLVAFVAEQRDQRVQQVAAGGISGGEGIERGLVEDGGRCARRRPAPAWTGAARS